MKDQRPYKDVFKSIPFVIGVVALISLLIFTFYFGIHGDKTIFDESLVSALAFVVLIVTAIMQNIDLKNQKEELVLTRQEYTKNVQELEKQTQELKKHTEHLKNQYENEKTNTMINRFNDLYKVYMSSLEQMRKEINYDTHFQDYIYNEFLTSEDYTVSKDFFQKYDYIDSFLSRLVLLEETISHIHNDTYKKVFYTDLFRSLSAIEFAFLCEYIEISNTGQFQEQIKNLYSNLSSPN